MDLRDDEAEATHRHRQRAHQFEREEGGVAEGLQHPQRARADQGEEVHRSPPAARPKSSAMVGAG